MSNNVCKTPRWRLLKAALNNLNAAAFQQKIAEGNVLLIDVRTEEEYATGCIKGAISMNYFGDQFLEKLAALDKSKTVLVYCRSGRRSIRVCTLLKNGGFDAAKIFNLEGGMLEWMAYFGRME